MSRRFVRSGRHAAQTPDRIVRVALAVAVAVHLLLALALYRAMRQEPFEEPGLIVRLLDAAPAEPPLPEPPPERPASTPETAVPTAAPVRSNPAPVGDASAPAAPAPASPAITSAQLFNADGSVRLAPAAKPTPHDAGMERGRELMARGHNILRCSQNAFDPRPTAEEQGNDAIRGARLLGFMFQRPWDIQAQHDSEVERDVAAGADLTIAQRKVHDQACDDTFYRRRWPKKTPVGREQAADAEQP